MHEWGKAQGRVHSMICPYSFIWTELAKEMNTLSLRNQCV